MRVRVVGAGVMGRGIAQWAVAAGHTVEVGDVRREAVDEAVEFATGMLQRAAAKGRMGEEEARDAAARLLLLDDPCAEPADGAPELVIEAVREDLETKAALFAGLEAALPTETLFATNTSALSVTQLGARLGDPGRLAGLHFFNPVPLMRLVEVVPGAATRPEVPAQLVEFVEQAGHHAVTVTDTPGFLVNHVGRGLVTEALALLEEGVAEPAGIDRIAEDVLGLRMGPFTLMDLTGLDVTAAVIDTVWHGFRHEDRLRPSFLTPGRVAAGLHGRKTGSGWYAYGADAAADPRPSEPEWTAGGDAGRTLVVAGEGPEADRTRTALGLPATPPIEPNAVVLVPTWGGSVADAVEALALPPERTLGLDPLSLDGPRRVLARTPATATRTVRDAAAALHATAAAPAVSVVRDAPGSVAQRLLASLVSVATAVAERQIAAPDAVDLAVATGLGYPRGPLAWGDAVGPGRLLALHRALHTATGDPRYRPTRWLRERAQLGLPLTTPTPPLAPSAPHHAQEETP